MPFLIHLTVKLLSSSARGNFTSIDDYAVLSLTNAEWDRYKTSKNIKKSKSVELFLETPADLKIELFDSSTFGSDTKLGVATLPLFLNGSLLPDIPLLASQKRTLHLFNNDKDIGKIDIDFLLHYVYQSTSTPTDNTPIPYPFKNLVLEGGGVRGIAYGGALEVMEERNILSKIERVAGTSAGSIAGLCLALGADSKRIKRALNEINFASFADQSALTKGALHEGTVLSQAVKDLISQLLTERGITKEKLNLQNLQDATFTHLKQLHDDPAYSGIFKLYFAIATKVDFSELLKKKLSILDMKVFNHVTTPDLELWRATRISMSVPFYFAPVEYDGSYYVDGGVLYNYAVNIFDEQPGIANEQTLGLRVDTPTEIAKFLDMTVDAEKVTEEFLKKYDAFYLRDISSNIIDRITKELAIYQVTKTDDGRSVCVNSGSIETTEFGIEPRQREGLVSFGRDWCLSFFSWWDSAYRRNPTPTGPLEEAGKVKTNPQLHSLPTNNVNLK